MTWAAFILLLSETDGRFFELREALHHADHQQASSIAQDLTEQREQLRQLWREIDHPNDEEMRSKIGLTVGHKVATPPQAIGAFRQVDGTPLRRGDPVLVMLVNGGLVRGQILGWDNGEIVLHELLPVSLSHIQRGKPYRILPIKHVARIELLRRFNSTRRPYAVPRSLINSAGDYSPGAIVPEHARRIDLQTDNHTLLILVRNRVWNEILREPRSTTIEAHNIRPHYTNFIFTSCEEYVAQQLHK